MKKLLKTFVSLICLFSIFAAVAEELKSGTFEFGQGRKGYLYLPDNFKKGGDFKFMLFCHGRGTPAGQPGNVGTKAFDKFRQLANQKGYVIAVPPLVSTWYNARGERDTEDMLDFLAQKLGMNLNRIYLCGTSMGGLSVLTFAGRNSERVIAICDIFGVTDMVAMTKTQYKENIKIHYGGYYEDMPAFYHSRTAMNYVHLLKHIPLIIIHGEKDTLVPIEQSENLYNAIKALGGDKVELIKVPNLWHKNEVILGLEEKVFDFFEKAGK